MSVVYTNFYQKGSNIRLRLIDRYGNRRMKEVSYKPELYVLADSKTPANKISEFVGLHKEKLQRIQFKNFWEMRDYIQEHKDVTGFKMFGQDDFCNQFIAKSFRGNLEYNWRQLKVANVDIEVVSGYRDEAGVVHDGPFPEPVIEEDTFGDDAERERYFAAVERSIGWMRREFPDSVIPPPQLSLDAAFPITLIQLSTYNNVTGQKKMLVWGLPERASRGKYVESGKYEGGYDCEYFEFETEQDLLLHYVQYWFKEGFDAWTGWNIESFDNPYLYRRISRVLGEENAAYLSPWKDIKKDHYNNDRGSKSTRYEYQGVETLDFMQLYKKHRLITREEYSLDHISYVELKERKLDYSEAKTLTRLYFTDWCKYVDYGKKDIRLVDRLNDKLKYIQLSFAIAYKAKCNFKDTLGTVKPWNALMGWFLLERGIRPQVRRLEKEDRSFAGGFVKEPIPGFYRWLLSIDLNSLYPHIMQQYNLGVETKVTPEERFDILFDLQEEIRVMMLAEFDTKRKAALKKLMEAVAARSVDIVEELIAVGRTEFRTLREYNVTMTPNLHFFKRDRMSAPSEATREIYADRKKFKGVMQIHEQRAVWIKEYKEAHVFEATPEKRAHKAWDETFYASLLNGEIDTLLLAAQEGESENNSFQHGMKILMNAFYGAMTTRWFKDYFDVDIGEGICAAGRLINQWNIHYLNIFLNKDIGTKGHDFIPAGDTDSVEGSSEITINNQPTTIENFYDDVKGEVIERGADNFVKVVREPCLTPAVTSSVTQENRPVKYVSKHKVKKRMYKVSSGGKNVVITEDHSIMVVREGVLVGIKIRDMVRGDKIVKVC